MTNGSVNYRNTSSTETNLEKVERRIKNSFDRLFKKLFEHSVLVDASLIQALTSTATLRMSLARQTNL